MGCSDGVSLLWPGLLGPERPARSYSQQWGHVGSLHPSVSSPHLRSPKNHLCALTPVLGTAYVQASAWLVPRFILRKQ